MSSMRRIVAGISLATLVGIGSLVATAPRAQSGGLVPGGDPPELILLYTGDVIGYVDPCG